MFALQTSVIDGRMNRQTGGQKGQISIYPTYPKCTDIIVSNNQRATFPMLLECFQILTFFHHVCAKSANSSLLSAAHLLIRILHSWILLIPTGYVPVIWTIQRPVVCRLSLQLQLYLQCDWIEWWNWGEFNNASAFKRSLYWCQALHITNKDSYQSTSARRALALLNSPQVSWVLLL